MRAFARSLNLHHSSLLRVMQGQRGLSGALLARLGGQLGLTTRQLEEAVAFERSRKVLQLTTAPGFRPDARWIAARTGMDLDDVQLAVHLLLYHRRLVMDGVDQWSEPTHE